MASLNILIEHTHKAIIGTLGHVCGVCMCVNRRREGNLTFLLRRHAVRSLSTISSCRGDESLWVLDNLYIMVGAHRSLVALASLSPPM